MTPDIITAVHDPNLFLPYVAQGGDLASWANWLTFLRTLYGLKVSEAEHATLRQCTGRDPAKLAGDFSECLLLCGRRSGKSKIIALVGAAEAVLSGKEQGLSKGEIPMVAILSPTRFQSRIIFSYLKGVFESTPLLQGEVECELPREGMRLKNGVEIHIITGDPKTCRGFSVIAAIVDEIAMFGFAEESKVRSDTELVRALRPSLASTGGRLLAVGTPYAARGYAYETFKRAYGNDAAAVLCWNAPSLLMNKVLKESIVNSAIAEDPVAASVEYCVQPGLFREDVETFITRAAVEALVIRGRQELGPQGNRAYAAFADLSGGRHDDAALAIAHMEDRVIVLDCLERYKSPHIPAEVVGLMADALRRYGLEKVVGDAYSAEWSRTAFAQHGINYRRATTSVWKEPSAGQNFAGGVHAVAKPKSQLYAELLPRLHSGEIELLDSETMIVQLCSLQRRVRSGARDSIDHAPGAHDDLANVVAGVADAVITEKFAGAARLDKGAKMPEDPKGRKRRTRTPARRKPKRTGSGHIGDGCEELAKASDGKVTTRQVRMLRALSGQKRAMTRLELKTACGHWPDRKGYHRDWVNGLRDMVPHFVTATQGDLPSGQVGFTYTITAKGKALLAKLDKAREAQAKAAAKAKTGGAV
jgi:hypothetical protein